MIYGYARVSSDAQNLDGQLEELKAAGCDRIFREKISGAFSDRRELTRLIAKTVKGDTVVVSRLDRLGGRQRQTRDHAIDASVDLREHGTPHRVRPCLGAKRTTDRRGRVRRLALRQARRRQADSPRRFAKAGRDGFGVE